MHTQTIQIQQQSCIIRKLTSLEEYAFPARSRVYLKGTVSQDKVSAAKQQNACC